MTSARLDGGPPPTRRVPLAIEIAALVFLAVVDIVSILHEPPAHGLTAGLATAVIPGFGPAAAALAMLRRRFTARIGPLAAGVIGISALNTTLAALTPGDQTPGLTEILAIALLVGAACRRLDRYAAIGLAAAGGVAMTVAPMVRFGSGPSAGLLAVPAALLWGGSLAVGLVLRDTDGRRRAALAEARTAERLRLARELHDFVAHHVTGIVVRAQAARVVATAGTDAEVFREIEEAGSDALTAMRRLVGMLRTDSQGPPPYAGGIRAAVLDATSKHDGIAPDLPDELDRLSLAPETVTTVHRVVLEALTNVRRHAPGATDVRVAARVQRDALVVEVVNDGVRGSAGDGGGYGLIGMTERVTALGGTLRAGAESGRRWRITVRLPLDDAPEVAR
ncbi:histidine kinase [Actinomadura sp. DC4]|uniref:sensor histidine kinase n=1 Tax=Actinomadura sp. DC4 TaxID=3055069 RepID=UPI0025B058A0|nr:histidine kinase [Actinomadura sp. DC4]MDN3355969.1 histidine kinase [Actinomadura sp. DC4]